jgi:hypothetical protein
MSRDHRSRKYRWRAYAGAVGLLIVSLGVTVYIGYGRQWIVAIMFIEQGASVGGEYGVVTELSFSRWRSPGQVVSVTDEDIARICELDRLKQLSLSFTDVGDGQLGKLTGLPELEWLQVDCTNVSKKGLMDLGSFPRLKVLTVSSDQIDPDTEECLREKFVGIYIEKVRLVGNVRVVE